ncbi:MAG: sulfite exporter TauE/SafE family protein [Acidobacteria bacterium]|nr:sulfite exporter TauE/SafE family protein [Acidobacteriota bacterium]
MNILLPAVFGASLLGSLHCAGMCGGLVAFYAAGDASRGAARAVGHAAYNAGRLATYLALGAAAGALGAAVDLAGSLAGVQRLALVASGVLIVAWGAWLLLAWAGVKLPRLPLPPALQRALARGLRAAAGRPPRARALATGLVTGLLPCGWLYAFVITAGGAGSWFAGASTMAVFWAGTLPVMLALGLGVQAAAGPLRRHLPVACALAMIVVGLLAIAGRARALPPAGGGAPPCCAEHATGAPR